MTKLIRTLLALAVTLALTFSLTPFAQADTWGNIGNFLFRNDPSGGVRTATNSDVPLVIKYIGTQSGKVQVTGGNLAIIVGAEGSEAADATITGCGGTAGTIAVSSCTTLGAIVDRINASANWRAFILDGLRADTPNFVTLASTAATAATGLNINDATATSLISTISLGDCRDFTCGMYAQSQGIALGTSLKTNPAAGIRNVLWKIVEQTTYSSGSSTLTIIDADSSLRPNDRYSALSGSETTSTLWSQATGNTATDATWDFTATGFFCKAQHRCLVRVTNSVAMTARAIAVYATQYPIAPPY